MEPIENIINKYKNRILNIAIIAVSLLAAYNIYKDQGKVIQKLESNKQKELEKNEILSTISNMDKKYRSYKSFLNKKDVSLIIDNLGNIAEFSGAKIISIKPEPEQTYPLYVKYAFNLGVSVNNYSTLGKFINKLEKSDDVYMIETLGVFPEARGKDSDTIELTVNMKVSTFILKD